jgi:hypothetical protein
MPARWRRGFRQAGVAAESIDASQNCAAQTVTLPSIRPEMLPPSQSFGSSDFSFIHSKMMSDFVPQRLLNQAFQVFRLQAARS